MARRVARTGRHQWSVVERRFDWSTWRQQLRIVSTHKTRVAAEQRMGGKDQAVVARTSRVDHLPRLGLWWPAIGCNPA
jgi:hypothetical protein